MFITKEEAQAANKRFFVGFDPDRGEFRVKEKDGDIFVAGLLGDLKAVAEREFEYKGRMQGKIELELESSIGTMLLSMGDRSFTTLRLLNLLATLDDFNNLYIGLFKDDKGTVIYVKSHATKSPEGRISGRKVSALYDAETFKKAKVFGEDKTEKARVKAISDLYSIIKDKLSQETIPVEDDDDMSSVF
jgi:hypothetical protein